MFKLLRRDGSRCVVTGVYDWRFITANKELRERLATDASKELVICAHVIPESTNKDLEVGEKIRGCSRLLAQILLH